MRTIQERKLSMKLTVKDLLNQSANSTIVSGIPGFTAYQTTFNNNVSAIQSAREVQELNRSGLAVNKSELASDMVNKTIDVARKVKAYAVSNNNSVLEAEVSYTKSDLERSADTILRDKCQVIHARATANLSALSGYGVTAAVLTTLQNAINAFNAAIPKPRLGITTRKQATKQLEDLFAANDELLLKMDTLVEVVRLTQPVFYKNYMDARILVDAGNFLIPVRGKALDKNTLLPLSGVTVVAGEKKLAKRTTEKGYFQVKGVASGSHTFTFSKAGYKTLTVTVNVTDGERTEVEVVLEPL